jgi:hypothetical protein
MKKVFISIIIFILLSCSIASASCLESETSDPELYHDIVITSLSDTISTAITNYYKNILKETPGYNVWSTEIDKIERPNGDRTEYYLISVIVKPYIGAHNTVGEDYITIEMDPQKSRVVNYKHLKSFVVPH